VFCLLNSMVANADFVTDALPESGFSFVNGMNMPWD